jgi:hypothetical protein
MKVLLVKQDEVEFNLQEEKCEKISHNLFRSLTGYRADEKDSIEIPKMVVFKTKEEYQSEAYKYDLDLTKEILINSKGNIFCPLKDDKTPTKSKSEENTYATTNTQENKGE